MGLLTGPLYPTSVLVRGCNLFLSWIKALFPPMISISHLTRRYGPLAAVDDFSVEIGRGEIVGLLGHNGAGKTTVMKILTGFLEGLDDATHNMGAMQRAMAQAATRLVAWSTP